MTLAARLVSNSTWNVLALTVNVGLNLLILPFVIGNLGIVEFGLAGLIIACVAPALIFSTVLSQMTARELAQHLALEDESEGRRVFATALFLVLTVGASIFLILVLVGPWIAHKLFNLSPNVVDHLVTGFAFIGCGWLCQCLSGVFLALFIARQQYSLLAQVNIGATIAATALMFILVPIWPSAVTYLACQAAGFFVGFVAALLLALRLLPGWLSHPALYSPSLKRLVKVGGWQIAAQSGGTVASQADRYLLGAFMQVQQVGFYNIAQRLQEAIYIGVLKVGEVLFPLFSAMLEEREERQADVLFRASWLLNLLAACALGGIIPVASPLLARWTNAEAAAQSEQLLVTLAIAGMLGCGTNVFSFYLLGSGKTRLSALISVITAVVITGTSAWTLPLFGWQAAGWSSLAGMVVQMAAVTVLMRRSFELSDCSSRIVHFVLAPLLVGILVALALRLALGQLSLWETPSWWYVVAGYGVSALAVGIAILIASLLGPYGQVSLRDLQRIIMHFTLARKN